MLNVIVKAWIANSNNAITEIHRNLCDIYGTTFAIGAENIVIKYEKLILSKNRHTR